MKLSVSLKTFALVLAAGSFAVTGGALAHDHHRHHKHDKGEVVLDIIGGVIAGAVEAEQARKEAAEYERRCYRWRKKCRDGSDWACEKFDDNCDY